MQIRFYWQPTLLLPLERCDITPARCMCAKMGGGCVDVFTQTENCVRSLMSERLTHAEAKPTHFGPAESVLILIGRRYFLPRANTNLAFAHTPDAKMKLFASSPRGDERECGVTCEASAKSKKPLSRRPPAAITDCARVEFFAECNSNFIGIMQNRSFDIMFLCGNRSYYSANIHLQLLD